MSVQTFWMERTDQVAVGLRRYSTHNLRRSEESDDAMRWSAEPPEPEPPVGFACADGYHSALVYIGMEPAEYGTEGHLEPRQMVENDPRWPTECSKGCGYRFAEDDEWQMWQQQVYRRTDTGDLRVLHQGAPAPEAPAAEPGATWDAWWMPFSRGPDGLCLMVRCPDGHDWMVDSRASNCGLPDDDVHHCWVRHGDPRECHLTVDKDGLTCSAGAGSIQTPNWHGFLRDGLLVE